MITQIAILVCFQIGWFSCVLAAAAGRPWVGPLVVAAWVGVRLLLLGRIGSELLLLAGAAVIGFVADSSVIMLGAMSVPEVAQLGGPSALWLVALWVNLAGTLRGPLRWLAGRPALSAVLGAVSGPLAYAGGARMGAIELGEPIAMSVAIISLEWMIAMPLLMWLSVAVERWSAVRAPMTRATAEIGR